MKTSPYRPHGEFSLAWREDVLFVTYSDAWNYQAVEFLHKAAKEAWANPPRRPWAMFSDARHWTASSAETIERWWIFYQDAVANGMTTAIDVLPSTFHELMLKNLITKARSIANHHQCLNIEEALQWLMSQGFNPENRRK